MRMKSYFADTVQLAVDKARRELGPEAALVTSRTTSADARYLGQYEVVFVTDLPEPAEKPVSPSSPPAKPGGEGSQWFGSRSIGWFALGCLTGPGYTLYLGGPTHVQVVSP